jgi:assimilatory nitrate reductase catalytic subunit
VSSVSGKLPPTASGSGRGSSSQWHTETRTGRSAVLRKLAPQVDYLELHPDDADARGIRPTDRVRVSSRRGAIELRAFVTRGVRRGSVFVPMHLAAANVLTFASFDPQSRQPAYKACAVEVERVP